MLKKCLSLFLSVCLLLSVVPWSMAAERGAPAVSDTDALFLDFNGAKEESNSIYGGCDFDLAEHWTSTLSTEDTVTVDTAAGTMTATKTASNAFSYFYAMTWNQDASNRFLLNFDPVHAEVLQIRLRMSGFSAATAGTRLSLLYYLQGSNEQHLDGGDYSFGKGFAFNGEYMTLCIPLSDAFRNSGTVAGLKFNFWNLKGTGTAVFDYIYIGPKEKCLPAEPLYFEFDNKGATRYSSATYGGVDYDAAANWQPTYLSGGAKDGVAADFAKGTLTLSKTKSNTYSYAYLRTAAGLSYRPDGADYLQMRLKFSGFSAATASTRFALNWYGKQTETQYLDAASYSFGKGYVFEGDFMTLTLPLNEAFRTADVISSIKLNFWNLGGTGNVIIDYVFIGRLSELPQQQPLQYGYQTEPGQVLIGQKDSLITEGVTESTIRMDNAEGTNPVVGFMTTIAPDAKVTFKAAYGGYYTAGSTPESRKAAIASLAMNRTTTTAQAAEYEAATGDKVLMATNGDYFNMNNGDCLGYLIMEGNLVQEQGEWCREEPYFAVLKDGTYAIRDYGSNYDDVQEAVSGPYYLVKNGIDVTGGIKKECHPRNSVGLREDGTVVLFVADGRQSGYSMGLTLEDLAQFFLKAGCYVALYLDGGGSATYASVHKGATALRLRNSPSDGTERTVASTLLLVAKTEQCQHSYSTYQDNRDGTHEAVCTKCGIGQSQPHSYQKGICICGQEEPDGDYLFFDFTNTPAAQERYHSELYGSCNFDTPNSPNWVSANNNHAYHFNMNNRKGFLFVGATENTAGPYIETTRYPGVMASKDNMPLHFDPSNSDVMLLRMKILSCEAASGTTAELRVRYGYIDQSGQYKTAEDMVQPLTLPMDDFTTITIPLSAQFKSAKRICSVGLHLANLISTTGGSAYFDYLYIGAEARTQETTDHILFDFTDTDADRERYYSPTYTGCFFDHKSAWQPTILAEGNDKLAIDHESGTLTVHKTAENTYSYFYAQTAIGLTHRLAYVPKAGDLFQIRMKLKGFDTATAKSSFSLNFYKNDSQTQVKDAATYSFGAGSVFNGETLLLTLPLSQEFCSAEVISGIKLNFWNLGGTGSVEVDYVYIGSEDGLPTPHSYSYKVTTAPTLSATGTLTGSCAQCAATTTVTLPKLNPADYTKVVVKAASCTESGTDSYRWDITAYGVFTFSVTTPAKGHSHIYTNINGLVHRVSCGNCDWSVEAAHSYVDGGCVCGETEIKEPVELASLKLSHSLNLASDISVNLVLSKAALTGFDMATVYVESVVEGGKTLKIAPVEQGNYYYFTVTGLTAIHMSDRIRSTLYGTKDGQPYYSPVDDYAVADYAYAVLNANGMDGTMKTLCADLLRYGAKAQIYKKYRTDNLADGKMTEAHKAYLSDLEAVTFGNTNQILSDVANAPITWAGKTLNLESKVALKFVFNPKNFAGKISDLRLRVSYKDINGTVKNITVETAELFSASLGYYVFTVDTLLAAELRAAVSVQIFDGDTPVSCTMQFSADTYGNNQTGDLLTLCKALMAYSDSAKAFFLE